MAVVVATWEGSRGLDWHAVEPPTAMCEYAIETAELAFSLSAAADFVSLRLEDMLRLKTCGGGGLFSVCGRKQELQDSFVVAPDL